MQFNLMSGKQNTNSEPECHQFSYFVCKTGSQTVKNSTSNALNVTILSSKYHKKSGEDTQPSSQTLPIGEEDTPQTLLHSAPWP